MGESLSDRKRQSIVALDHDHDAQPVVAPVICRLLHELLEGFILERRGYIIDDQSGILFTLGVLLDRLEDPVEHRPGQLVVHPGVIIEHIIFRARDRVTLHDDVHAMECFLVRLGARQEVHRHAHLSGAGGADDRHEKGQFGAGVLLVYGLVCRR